MWVTEYSDEAKFYFLDNDPYTFPLLIRIEELKHLPNTTPPEGWIEIDEPNQLEIYLWEVLSHLFVVRKHIREQIIYIVAVKPLE